MRGKKGHNETDISSSNEDEKEQVERKRYIASTLIKSWTMRILRDKTPSLLCIKRPNKKEIKRTKRTKRKAHECSTQETSL